jgi:hypothetical protein
MNRIKTAIGLLALLLAALSQPLAAYAATLDGNRDLTSATVAITLESDTQNVEKQATAGDWAGYWDFGDKNGDGTRDDAVDPGGLSMGGYYLRHNPGISGNSISLQFSLNGGDLLSSSGYISVDAGRNIGGIWIHDVRDVLMGDGYLSAIDINAGQTTSTAGDIRIGQPDLLARHVQINGITKSRIGTGTGGVFINGSGDVLIKDASGTPANIQVGETTTTAPTGNDGNWSRLEVSHRGDFLANDIFAIFKAYESKTTSEQKAIRFDGWYLGAGAPLGSFEAKRIDTQSIVKIGASKAVNAPSIMIGNYASVSIQDVIADAWDGGGSGNNTGTSGSLVISNIVGNISITGEISLNAETAGITKDGILHLECGGSILLAGVDMSKVNHARLSATEGTSVSGELLNFAVAGSGAGTEADPVLTTQTALRAPNGQTISYDPAANPTLDGKVYRVADLTGVAASGGLLMPAKENDGTVIIVR